MGPQSNRLVAKGLIGLQSNTYCIVCWQYNVQRQALVKVLQRGFLEALYGCSVGVPDTDTSRSQPAKYLPAPPMISVPATAHFNFPYGRPIISSRLGGGVTGSTT